MGGGSWESADTKYWAGWENGVCLVMKRPASDPDESLSPSKHARGSSLMTPKSVVGNILKNTTNCGHKKLSFIFHPSPPTCHEGRQTCDRVCSCMGRSIHISIRGTCDQQEAIQFQHLVTTGTMLSMKVSCPLFFYMPLHKQVKHPKVHHYASHMISFLLRALHCLWLYLLRLIPNTVSIIKETSYYMCQLL